jgi:hypothetical protein
MKLIYKYGKKNVTKKWLNKKCKLTFCNEGCKGTILSKNKMPKHIEKNNFLDKTQLNKIRKETTMVENFPKKMPKSIANKYKNKGAISICEPYIKDGTTNLLANKL